MTCLSITLNFETNREVQLLTYYYDVAIKGQPLTTIALHYVLGWKDDYERRRRHFFLDLLRILC